MSRTTHVVLGDSVACSLNEGLSIPTSSVTTLRDSLSNGPLSELRDAESWSAMRLEFWDRVYQGPEHQKPRRPRRERSAQPRLIRSPERIADADEVVLWIGTGLDDQLTLAWMPQFLRVIGSDVGKLRVVQFERTTAGAPIRSLRFVTPTELIKHPAPRPFGEEKFAYLDEAWSVLTAPDPALLVRFLGQESSPLPLLQSAMKCILRRYPDVRSGVNRFEQSLLASTRRHGPVVANVVGRVLVDVIGGVPKEFVDIDSVGDHWLFWRLQRLADPTLPHPAVMMTGELTTIRGTEVRLTPVGEQVARKELNFVRLNGIDDWIGGVHLDSRGGNVWFDRQSTIERG